MIVDLPNILSPELLSEARRLLESAEWVDGRTTAGHLAAAAKDNQQLATGHPVAQQVGRWIVHALTAHPHFVSAALPARILPPMFNRYGGGQQFGTHVDGAIRPMPAGGPPLRADISATLFINGPEEYDGGELVVQDTYGTKRIKLPAGHIVVYPASSLHHVTPVTRGTRLCSFFWIQSLVRDNGRREILGDLDTAIQRLSGERPVGDSAMVRLTGVYHNLLRQWAEP